MEHHSITIIIAAFHETRNIIRPALQHCIQAKLIQNLRWFLNLLVTDYIEKKQNIYILQPKTFFPLPSRKQQPTNPLTNKMMSSAPLEWFVKAWLSTSFGWSQRSFNTGDLHLLPEPHRVTPVAKLGDDKDVYWINFGKGQVKKLLLLLLFLSTLGCEIWRSIYSRLPWN